MYLAIRCVYATSGFSLQADGSLASSLVVLAVKSLWREMIGQL